MYDVGRVSFYYGHSPLTQEALEFLEQHPRVQPGGLGMVGISKGGEIVLHISTISQKVSATSGSKSGTSNSN